MATNEFCIRIFVPSGNPEGIRIVEKSNWIGFGIVFPRSGFSEAREREEMSQPGIYILWGPSESGILPKVYIGQADDVAKRMTEHIKKKDFWTHAVVFTTSCKRRLDIAHFKHIEARLYVLAVQAKRAELDNQNQPNSYSLSEADTAEAEAFLQDILLCLPFVGVDFFERAEDVQVEAPYGELYLQAKGKGVSARGAETSSGFVVKKDSKASKEEYDSISEYAKALRKELMQQGVLKDDGSHYVFTQDYVFNSPSSAAGVVLGRAANGLTEWKDRDGRTLKQIREMTPTP